MKRSVFALAGVLALLLSFSVPAQANGVAQGKTFSIAVYNLPDTCPVDATMQGKGVIRLADDGTRTAKLVQVDITVDTPFGDVTVMSETFRMRPGTTRTVPLAIFVPENVPTGEYDFEFEVTVKGESLTVGHEVQVFNRF